MVIEQIYTSCLSQASYFISSNGESAVIDPIRDTDIYIKKAEKMKSKIKYVFQTHFHADFVSGTYLKKQMLRLFMAPMQIPNMIVSSQMIIKLLIWEI